MKPLIISISVLVIINSCNPVENSRTEVSLNGTWELSRTDLTSKAPTLFEYQVQVPGLVDMAIPVIQGEDSALFENSTYWYRKTFTLDHSNRDVVKLKINKAKYNTTVYLNDHQVGENSYCFTPTVFDIKSLLNESGEDNILLISVGCKNNLPDTVVGGYDFEKTKYIPGIYDDVTLILTNSLFIKNIQTVPNIEMEELRIVAEIETKNQIQKVNISYVIREVSSKQQVVQGILKNIKLDGHKNIDFTVQIPGCNLWSPEDPFLYELELSTQNDLMKTRFGMRTFSLDTDAGIGLLNGKPYYMRGTNVCIFRFFEDPDRNGLPWDDQWVTNLHEKFKEMNWNSIRYCIGFPPERWYDIADSLGFIIQDEYPVWTSSREYKRLLGGVSSDHLSAEYEQWMRERWNHPCVTIWDAQNESVTPVVGEAIQKIRHIDLSNRPWDNGWAAPVSETDFIESHPYLFNRFHRGAVPSDKGVLKDLLSEVLIPDNDPNERDPASNGKWYNNPIIINEYGWIWVNRNGTPTTLTDKVYQVVFPEADTPEKRLKVYAKTLGILTEYWRVHRKSAAVLHFCGLGYSRPDPPRGQTSDNFIDLKNLTFEPSFYRYVKPAFNPVGLMIEVWDRSFKPGETVDVPVHMINDTYENYNSDMKLSIRAEDEIISEQIIACEIEKLGKKVYRTTITMPELTGEYKLVAEIINKGVSVTSIRDFYIE